MTWMFARSPGSGDAARGKRLVIVVGNRRALAIATATETTQRRETLLVERLQDRAAGVPLTG